MGGQYRSITILSTGPVIQLPDKDRLAFLGHPIVCILVRLDDLTRASKRGQDGLVGGNARVVHNIGEHAHRIGELLLVSLGTGFRLRTCF